MDLNGCKILLDMLRFDFGVDDMNAAVGLFDLLTFDFGVDDLMIGLFDLDLDILVSIGSGLFLGRI